MKPEFALMSVKNFQALVIYSSSRNQILNGFDVDWLCPSFQGSIERIFLFIRQTHHFSSALVNETSSIVSEKIFVRKSLASKAAAEKAESDNNDADETPRPPISADRAS